MKSVVLSGALIVVKINGKAYNESESVSWQFSYGLEEVYGIDSPFPQDMITTKTAVRGSVTGIRVKRSGGLQGISARPLLSAVFSEPYISIRIVERATGETLLFVPQAKISSQDSSVSARGVLTLSFNFSGLIGYETLDELS